jgi:diguanylate cyclase (GGDEF)-like protein
MSFRNRLTSFFVVIVLLPMLAVGLLVFRLISDSGQAKSEARASGLQAAALSLYASDEAAARSAAAGVARIAASVSASALPARLAGVARDAGLARIVLATNGHTILTLGSRSAIAPGAAIFRLGGETTTVTVSTTTAASFAGEMSGNAAGVVIRQGRSVLASSVSGADRSELPARGTVTLGGVGYEAVTSSRLAGFGRSPVDVTVLSDLRATNSSLSSSRLLAGLFIIGFLVLAFSFAVLASRGLESQLGRFLRAARRLAGGDFSAPVPVEGNDEFAMLAVEFNNMSQQLAQRLEQLAAERGRLRESIRRAGQTFASNLDRQALLELALKTAMDGVEAEFGRLSARPSPDEPLWEVVRENSLTEATEDILAAERKALAAHELCEYSSGGATVAAVPLGPISSTGRPFGVLTVGRRRPFSADDLDLLGSLVGQTTLALENIELHQEVQQQAVTDELTGLGNHGRFQEVLRTEMEQVRRYHYPVGLIMLDLDNFKQINDTYGHPQGDLVLRAVAQVMKDSSREADFPARYGGEEMALILPHTDLEGSHAIAERVRAAVEELRIPLLDGSGILRVTGSLGVAADSGGDKDGLIAETDAALYKAKRSGKNRTVRAAMPAARAVASD